MARFTENEIKVIKQFNLNYDNLSSELSDNAVWFRFDGVSPHTRDLSHELGGTTYVIVKL